MGCLLRKFIINKMDSPLISPEQCHFLIKLDDRSLLDLLEPHALTIGGTSFTDENGYKCIFYPLQRSKSTGTEIAAIEESDFKGRKAWLYNVYNKRGAIQWIFANDKYSASLLKPNENFKFLLITEKNLTTLSKEDKQILQQVQKTLKADIYQVNLAHIQDFDKTLALMCQTLSDNKESENSDKLGLTLFEFFIGTLGVLSNAFLYFQLIMNTNGWNFSFIQQIPLYLAMVLGVMAFDYGIIWLIYYKSYLKLQLADRSSCLKTVYEYVDYIFYTIDYLDPVIQAMVLILAMPPSLAAIVMLISCLVSQVTDLRTKITFSCHMGAYIVISIAVVVYLRYVILKDQVETIKNSKEQEILSHYRQYKLKNQKLNKRSTQVQIE
ncbi:hypothetical protein FGO68_gene3142 [Halteria grandinella]|uniref:Uncharacterized protein n=1 Tax=Halteria grandinella TaxID=5974 RepID=A0A8J8NP06_HALGN|nr:hypothetical protein FGO68_gene3142 [Halteria grandinella]